MKKMKMSYLALGLLMISPISAQLGYLPQGYENAEPNLTVEIDYLLYLPYLDGLAYSTTFDTYTLGENVIAQRETDNFFKNSWNSGARIGVDWAPPCFGWDFSVIYTYFSSQVKDTLHFPQADMNISSSQVFNNYQYSPNGLFQGPTFSFGKWRLNFNQLDCDLGKDFSLSSDVSFRPIVGIRALWLNHLLQMFGSYPQNNLSLGPIMMDSAFDARTHYIGAGPKLGFATALTLLQGLELVGHLTGSILYGYFKLGQSLTLTEENIPNNTTKYNHSDQSTIFNVGVGFDLRWSYYFDCKRQFLTALVGWEHETYSDMNRIQNILLTNTMVSSDNFIQDSNVQRGYLSLSGFKFGIGYSF